MANESVAFGSLKANSFNATPLADHIDKQIVIAKTELADSEYDGKPTKVPILILADGTRLYTYSKVIAKSIATQDFVDALAAGKTVTATVREKRGKQGTYHYFE